MLLRGVPLHDSLLWFCHQPGLEAQSGLQRSPSYHLQDLHRSRVRTRAGVISAQPPHSAHRAQNITPEKPFLPSGCHNIDQVNPPEQICTCSLLLVCIWSWHFVKIHICNSVQSFHTHRIIWSDPSLVLSVQLLPPHRCCSLLSSGLCWSLRLCPVPVWFAWTQHKPVKPSPVFCGEFSARQAR